MTLPPDLAKVAKEMVGQFCEGRDDPFLHSRIRSNSYYAGFRACYEHLATMGPEFDLKASQKEFNKYQKGLFCVDSWHRSGRFQHSLMSAQLAARDAKIAELERDASSLKENYEKEIGRMRWILGEGGE